MRIFRALVPLACTLSILGTSATSSADVPPDAVVTDAGSGSNAVTDAPDAGSSGSAVVTAPSSSPTADELPVAQGDDMDFAKKFYEGITTKNWFLAIGAALALLTHGVRWLLLKKWPSWSKDRWGWALAAGMAGVVALSSAWIAGAAASSADTWLGAVKLFAASVLAYVTTKKVILPGEPSSNV